MSEHRDALQLVDLANNMLRHAGFEVASVSLKSEATYWRWPGRRGVIRVSSHKFKGTLAGLDRVLARITFRGGKERRHMVCISQQRVEGMVATAIGSYMLKSSGVVTSTYSGPRDGRKLTLLQEVSP